MRLLRRIATRKGREAEGVVLVEGPRVIETALAHEAELLFAMHSASSTSSASLAEILARLKARGIEIVDVSPDQLREFAQTDTPQGILAIAREPKVGLHSPEASRGERVLLLDRIQDPGNVGTLVRAAAALTVDRVFILDGTADPWSAKAVRACTGLAFHLPLHVMSWDEAMQWVSQAGLPLLVAHGPGEDVRSWLARSEARGAEAISLDGEPWPMPSGNGWALLIGNEGEGPRQEAFDRADALLSIPLAEGVESLNAAMAGAILLWALGPGRARTE